MDEQVESSSASALRDHLALDRTALATERTLLSYMRTGLALIAMGAGGAAFFDSLWLIVSGWIGIAVGCITLLIGAHRYRTMHRRLVRLRAEEKRDDRMSH